MLRHKTLQQSARLAFGISVLDLKSPNPSEDLSKKEMHSQNGNALNAKKNSEGKINL
jgi:hypothetical protein